MDVTMAAVNSLRSTAEGANLSPNAGGGRPDTHGGAGQRKIDIASLQKTVSQINHHLTESNTRVVFEVDNQVHRIWLNVVNQSTGQVVAEIPPETVRHILQGYAETKGLTFNRNL